MSCHILCAHEDPQVMQWLGSALHELAGDAICFSSYEDAQSLLKTAQEIWKAEGDVAMVFCSLKIAGTGGEDLFLRMKRNPLFRGTRKILLDTADDPRPIDFLLQAGAMEARLDPYFDIEFLKNLLRHHLTDYVAHMAPHLIDDLYPLLDLQGLGGALSSAKKKFELLTRRMGEVRRSVIGDGSLSDATVEDGMVNEFDRLLDRPERHTYAPGEDLVREGDEAGRIWIILDGKVKLIRNMEGEELIFHSESAGKIVGLMSLSLQNPVFFTCRAVTEVKAVILDREQVGRAVHESPVLAQYLITVMMRGMARRNARAAELLMEVRTLNKQLGRQRDELAGTLEKLRATQNQLIDSAKMATLGNLAAGMAHELNNPVGALIRSAEHMEGDLIALLGMASDMGPAQEAIPVARSSPPLSTREERKLRAGLAEDLGIDSADAVHLIGAGVHSREQFQALAGRSRAKALSARSKRALKQRLISEISLAGQIGIALRNIVNCSGRIAELVRSLKIYARNEPDYSPDVNVNQTLDDVLLILSNRLKTIDLHKDYGDLPVVRANSSQLQQIWTNLISNAVQALDGEGEIAIRSSIPRDGWIRVEVEDNGPGIPEDARKKLWDVHFTTRSGRVEFGLGLGLSIVKTIVRQHQGEITFTSEAGRTVFTVDLPVSPKES